MAPLSFRNFVSLDVSVFPRRYFGGTSRLCREVLLGELPVHEIVQETQAHSAREPAIGVSGRRCQKHDVP